METAIKSRVSKNKKGGRDYHASLKRAVNAYIKNPTSIKEILANFETIKKKPERDSAKAGFNSTIEFLAKNGGNFYQPEMKIFKHLSGFYTVRFQPNFGIVIDDKQISVHLWNTKMPITQRAVTAVLGLFVNQYSKNEYPAVYCLKTNKLFLANKTQAEQRLAIAFSERIDGLIQKYTDVEAESKEAKGL